MSNSATISADIVSYSSLGDSDKRLIETKIRELLNDLSDEYKEIGFFGRLVQGDYIECAINSPFLLLRIALIIKTFVKSIGIPKSGSDNKRLKYFEEYGVRMALAVAPLSTLDAKRGIIDGEAIYLSGRKIKNESTSGKQKIVIKNTLFFCSPVDKTEEQFDAILSLLDTIISQCSAKQCEVVYYKLCGLSEQAISQQLNRTQSTISQHSTAAGWNAIEKSINYFEKYIV